MADRLSLHEELVERFGSPNVYYQPPANLLMNYPAIRYNKAKIESINAGDKLYLKNTRYEVTVISRTPDHPVINRILELPHCVHDRTYITENLYHDLFTLYW